MIVNDITGVPPDCTELPSNHRFGLDPVWALYESAGMPVYKLMRERQWRHFAPAWVHLLVRLPLHRVSSKRLTKVCRKLVLDPERRQALEAVYRIGGDAATGALLFGARFAAQVAPVIGLTNV